MTTLAELMARDHVTGHFFWTHEVSTGPYKEYEVWDLLLIRNSNEPKLWVTDGDTRRTAHFQGIGGAQVDSRRETGGARREPDLFDTLAELLFNARQIEEYPTFAAWAKNEYDMGSSSPAWEMTEMYAALTKDRDMIRAWLPDAYDEYLNADRD